MLRAQSRQKSYADHRHREMEFEVGDHMFLKVSPTKGIMRFGKNSKLCLRCIEPFRILERIGMIAYQLALPLDHASVHPMFHVSIL